jgi:hypothetical protein
VAAFCGKCGARAARPDLAFCTQCGARLAAGPAVPPSAGPPRPVGGTVLRWEIVALGAIVVVWLGYTFWRAGPAIVSLVRGDALATGRLIETVAILLLPPLAIVVFLASRLAGRGGWRSALPLLAVVPVVSLATTLWLDDPAPSSGAAAGAVAKPGTPGPGPTVGKPSPGGTPTPTVSGPLGLPIPIPIPKRDDPTPLPTARLTAERARERVRESLDRCLLLRREIDFAEVTYEPPNWTVTLPVTRYAWSVDDATGTVTPNDRAAERQRLCLG